MADPIIVIDTSRIHDGKLDELKVAFAELAEFVEANETTPLAYNVFIDEEAMRVTVLQVHPDSASVEDHLKAAAHLFPRFADLLTLQTMEIYGAPSPALLEQTRTKALMLGNVPVTVAAFHAGFVRMPGA